MNHSYEQPYVVVSAIAQRSGGKILLIQENHLPDKGKWNLPGGKLDFGEDPKKAVAREVFEETGLKFKPAAIAGVHSVYRKDVPNEQGMTHVLKIVYFGSASGSVSHLNSDEVNGEQEISDYKWLKPQEIIDMKDDLIRYHDTKHCIKNVIDDNTLPLDVIPHLRQG